ncbi:glycosyltransferase family 4 protein [Halomonas daqingensis]|uniref:Glycosyltransferase family 4 protein n=1 Tax=Billgrantia desiderata TaxID=52021 RepID=A0ABS9AZA0_9GAMM|nr:glycosyltransferase family 4 protein [Halomonas desiderata]MCE8040712.1 glycosyltransferase family 4 protein [Halomonas desiderata]MCE8045287.1 glycosyltransferase family 4 protein [Halomonas desiderata]
MKVALVHDWLITYAGAERVVEQILALYPSADIFSVVDFLSDDQRGFVRGKSAQTTFIQKLPFAQKKYRGYLPLMPLAVEQLDVSDYDLVISSSHAVAKGVITGPNQLHICYCHSPIRYAWDLQHQYLREAGLTKGPKSWLARWFLHKMRLWDLRTTNGVDHFVANSDYISRRIKKVYGRSATTIYPNVAVEDFSVVEAKENFYVTASRLVPYKKVDLIVRAFATMPDKQLVVIGDGPQMGKVRAAATPNIQVLGYQPFDVLKDHMARAKAFVFAAEEDFGIIPVEAQACGTPVIAYGKGGARETVVSGETGVFFDEQTEASLQAAIGRFEADFVIDPWKIRQHAERFSTAVFQERFKSFVESRCQDFFGVLE